MTVDGQENQRDRDVELLFDVLTGYECTSHEEVAAQAGWPLWRVGYVLRYIRRPDVAEEWGWTVPHAPRGPGEHLYQAVLVDDAQTYTAGELRAHKRGARSTLRMIATESMNEANSLRALARNIGAGRARRLLNQTADAYTGAGAMAAAAADAVADDLNGA